MFKKDTHIKMTKDDYHTVISEKDKIIENLSLKIDKMQEKQIFIDTLFQKYKISGYDMLIDIVKDYKTHKCKCNCISVKESKEYKELQKKDETIYDNISEHPEYIKINEELIISKNKEQELEDNIRDELISEYNDKLDGLNMTIEDLRRNNNDKIDHIEKLHKQLLEQKDLNELKDEINDKQLPSPSTSTENNTKYSPRLKTHKFENKSLPILERCNVIAYNNFDDSPRTKEIIDFISSEYKIIIRFNSIIVDKIHDNNDDIWESVYKFKTKNGDLKDNDYNKKNFKYKFIRCKELYDLYGENLSKFRIYVNYIGKLPKKEWSNYLEEFNKLYNDTFKNMEACQHKYKDGKICGIFDCNLKHKESK